MLLNEPTRCHCTYGVRSTLDGMAQSMYSKHKPVDNSQLYLRDPLGNDFVEHWSAPGTKVQVAQPLAIATSASMWFPLFLVCSLISASCANPKEDESSISPPDYGVDSSYPMHHPSIINNYPWLPHNVDQSLPTPPEYSNVPINPLGSGPTERYNHYIQGCVDFYNANGNKGERCRHGEKDRIEMTLRQPASVYNYTDAGYAKLRAPARVMQLLTDFWQANKQGPTKE